MTRYYAERLIIKSILISKNLLKNMCTLLSIDKMQKNKTKLCIDIRSNEINKKYKRNIAKEII